MIEHNSQNKTLFGFWIYMMTDLIMFGVLFATYAVLRNRTFGGPSGGDIFGLNQALLQTIVLLVSSFTAGLAAIAINEGNKKKLITWLSVTFLLGAFFLSTEINEFRTLIAEGFGPGRSAFLSAFFGLTGTHGLHIAVGLLWIIVSLIFLQVKGLNPFVASKINRLILFWHFLDIVWIFIFTMVYLSAKIL